LPPKKKLRAGGGRSRAPAEEEAARIAAEAEAARLREEEAARLAEEEAARLAEEEAARAAPRRKRPHVWPAAQAALDRCLAVAGPPSADGADLGGRAAELFRALAQARSDCTEAARESAGCGRRAVPSGHHRAGHG
jgi:hypothetical protein